MINKPLWLVELEQKGEVNPNWISPAEVRYYNKNGSFFEATLSAFLGGENQKSFCAVVWDGCFPPRDGATIRTYSYLQGLGKQSDVVLVLAWREWTDMQEICEMAKDLKINILLVNSKLYYTEEWIQKILNQFEKVIIRDFEIVNAVEHPQIYIDCQELRWRLLIELEANPETVEEIKQQELMAFSKAKKIFAISKVEKELLKMNGVPAEKIVHVPQSYEPKSFETPYFDTKEKPINLLYIGHLTYEPNKLAVEYILDKLEPEVRKLRKNVRFHIVGFCPPDLRQRGNSNVIFYGEMSLKDIKVLSLGMNMAIAPISKVVGQVAKIITYIGLNLPILGSIPACQGYENLISKGLVVSPLETFALEIVDRIKEPFYLDETDVIGMQTEIVFGKVLEELKK